MDEKWKLSKKGSRNASSRREQPSSSSAAAAAGAYLKRSSSMPESVKGARNRPNAGPSTNQRNFTSRCTNVVKEQRAKFYIVRRCVNMLICWRDYP